MKNENYSKIYLFLIIALIVGLWAISHYTPRMDLLPTAFAEQIEDAMTGSQEAEKEEEVKVDALWDTDWSNAFNILLTLILTSILSALVSYRRKGGKEQLDFTEAHVVLSVSAALMMMIIGSKIARAFGLMGAASIVRYRYSLKSPKEASSLVVALGIGMACGVGLYPLAVIVAAYIAAMIAFFENMPSKLVSWLFPTKQIWNARIRTLSPDRTVELIEDFLDDKQADFKIKRMQEGKGPENDQTEIEIDIYDNIDTNAFADSIKDDNLIRIRWKKTDN